MCNAFTTGMVERTSQNLAIDGNNAPNDCAETRGKSLERGAELFRIQQSEQPAEGVVTGQPVLQLQETA